MKSKSWLLVISFGLCAWGVKAQELSLGIHLGASYPSTQAFDFANDDGLDGLGLHGGVIGQYRLGAWAGTAAAHYDYNQFGGSVNGFDTDYFYTRLVFPLGFRYYLTDGLSLRLGARLGVLITAESEVSVKDQGVERHDISLTTASTDLGAFFGVGYDTPIGVTFSLAYNAGLTDFPSAGDRLSGPSFSLGYTIFKNGSQRSGTPAIKGKKWKPGRTRSGR